MTRKCLGPLLHWFMYPEGILVLAAHRLQHFLISVFIFIDARQRSPVWTGWERVWLHHGSPTQFLDLLSPAPKIRDIIDHCLRWLITWQLDAFPLQSDWKQIWNPLTCGRTSFRVCRVIRFLRGLFFCVYWGPGGLCSLVRSGMDEKSLSVFQREGEDSDKGERKLTYKHVSRQTKARKEPGRWVPLTPSVSWASCRVTFWLKDHDSVSLVRLPLARGEKLPETLRVYWKPTSHCPSLCSTKIFIFRHGF